MGRRILPAMSLYVIVNPGSPHIVNRSWGPWHSITMFSPSWIRRFVSHFSLVRPLVRLQLSAKTYKHEHRFEIEISAIYLQNGSNLPFQPSLTLPHLTALRLWYNYGTTSRTCLTRSPFPLTIRGKPAPWGCFPSFSDFLDLGKPSQSWRVLYSAKALWLLRKWYKCWVIAEDGPSSCSKIKSFGYLDYP